VTLDLDTVYASRFSDEEAAVKDRIWREIARFLERYVDGDATVLDVACDRGDFIRNIRAGEKWAIDVRDVARYLPSDVRFVLTDGLTLADELPGEHFDVVFMSNYLEHLPSSDAVVDQMRAIRRVLKPRGRMIVLQPNIRLVGARYWDFIDHRVALTDRSLVEAAELAGFRPHTLIKRFLPYNTKTRMPKGAALGKQSLLVAEKA
jgi:SAM-dependent methyltransferase